ncbi:hypothetical protein D3C84_761600 [compost metagenome]
MEALAVSWLNAKADRKIAAGAAATLPPQRVELLLQHVEHALVLFLRLLFQLLLGVVQALRDVLVDVLQAGLQLLVLPLQFFVIGQRLADLVLQLAALRHDGT